MFSNIITFSAKTDDNGFATTGTVISVVILAVIGIGAYIQWGGSAAGSAPTVDGVISAHQSVDSFQYDTSLTLDAQLKPDDLQNRSDSQRLRRVLQYIPNAPSDGFPESLTAELSVSGGTSLASSTINQAQSDISLSVGVDQPDDVLAMNFRRTNGQQYLRAETLPDIGFFSLGQYEGQWYSASSTESAGVGSAELSGQLPSGVPEDASVSPETTRQLVQAMFSEGVISVDDKVRTELRSGAPAWQFQIGVNPGQAESYRQAARDIISENHPDLVNESELFATSSDASNFAEGLEKFKSRVDSIDVWVDRNSDRIRRVVIESEFDQSELQDMRDDTSQVAGIEQVTLTFDAGLSAYNEPITVEVPENAQPLQSVFGGGMMMPGGSGQSGSGASSQPIQY